MPNNRHPAWLNADAVDRADIQSRARDFQRYAKQHQAIVTKTTFVTDESGDSAPTIREKVLAYLTEHGQATNQEMAHALGYDASNRIAKSTGQMVKRGELVVICMEPRGSLTRRVLALPERARATE